MRIDQVTGQTLGLRVLHVEFRSEFNSRGKPFDRMRNRADAQSGRRGWVIQLFPRCSCIDNVLALRHLVASTRGTALL